MQATTWKDKVADASNLWLSATGSEEDGRSEEAAVFYLRDAADCLRRGLGSRAALSCSCAASCLEKEGNLNAARHLYLEAAKIYSEQADAIFGTSIREALWLLQQAHDHFILGGDGLKAAQIYNKCASLAKKLSPFVTSETVDEILRIRRDTAVRSVPFSVSVSAGPQLDGEVGSFLRLREAMASRAKSPRTAAPAATATVTATASQQRTRRRPPSVEKSIIS